MIESKEIAEIIKTHRKVAGLSQLELAEMAGVGKTSVFDVEKGKETIQLNTLKKILGVLNINIMLISPITNQIATDENR